MTETYEYAVIGLGALGSATAYELAKRGHAVLGLEQFELGHNRGASHDTSRILRHSYHTPSYVELTQAAYDDWANLEVDSGEQLVTVVGGLDLFPPDAVITIDDYVSSLDAVGIDYELLVGRRDRRALATVLVAGRHGGALPGARRDGSCRSWHGDHAVPCAVTRSDSGRQRSRHVGARPGCRWPGDHRWRRDVPVSASRGLRRCVDQRGPRRSGSVDTADDDPRAGDVLRATRGPARSSPDTCRCGYGWTSPATTASRRTASRR